MERKSKKKISLSWIINVWKSSKHTKWIAKCESYGKSRRPHWKNWTWNKQSRATEWVLTSKCFLLLAFARGNDLKIFAPAFSDHIIWFTTFERYLPEENGRPASKTKIRKREGRMVNTYGWLKRMKDCRFRRRNKYFKGKCWNVTMANFCFLRKRLVDALTKDKQLCCVKME